MAPRRSAKKAPACANQVRPKPDTPNLLLTLPQELRNEVYLLALPSPDPVFVKKATGWVEAPLLLTCKEIRTEALPVYYGNNSFVLIVNLLKDGEIQAALTRLSQIVNAYPERPIQGLTLHLRYSNVWDHLEELLPLLELMRATGFEPAKKPYAQPAIDAKARFCYETDSSVFRMPRTTMGNAQFVCEKALSLARRARTDGWDQARLEESFAEFSKVHGDEKGVNSKILMELGIL